jgi:hypothetical protein
MKKTKKIKNPEIAEVEAGCPNADGPATLRHRCNPNLKLGKRPELAAVIK